MNFRYRNYYIHPKRSCSVFKVPGDDERGFWRCVFAVKPEETEEEVMSEEWIIARFTECLPIGMPYPILHKNLYTTHNRVADKFYAGRIALAGDAAHLNNPNGGMGMNSGFQDGMNIADKLKDIREGGDPEVLLSQYDRQRRETTIEFVQPQSIAGKQLMLESNLEKRREGMDRLRRIVSDPAQHHEYLYKASLLAMQHKADQIL
jgi:3-(3-hydroxy-phenyl)propionate hydroxylase